jgi:hypothetical protein
LHTADYFVALPAYEFVCKGTFLFEQRFFQS